MRQTVAACLATWFGCGRLPVAPGTWGSLAALPVGALLHWSGGPAAILAGAVAVFCIGIVAAQRYAAIAGSVDPPEVVIDEVAGQLLPLAVVPLDWWSYGLAFVLFRIADIAKPWPVGWIDRNVGGGFGIMADDGLAGVYAGLVAGAIVRLI